MTKKLRLLSPLFIVVLLASSCNMPSNANDQNASGTFAAQTVQALIGSATPILVPAVATPTVPPPVAPPTVTSIPMPINTSTPVATATSNCNVAQFVTDVTVPDRTVMTPGQKFTKKWRIKNVGACAWNGFSLVFDSGEAMGAPASTAVATLNPNQEIDLALDMTAPTAVGDYRGYWRIVTNGNVLVPVVGGYQNKSFYVDIKVQSATPTPTPTNTKTAFTVVSVTYTIAKWSDATHTDCPAITAKIKINSDAGVVKYHWQGNSGAVAGSNGSWDATGGGVLEHDVTFNFELPSTAPAGAQWISLYIDSPDNKDFDHKALTPCTAP